MVGVLIIIPSMGKVWSFSGTTQWIKITKSFLNALHIRKSYERFAEMQQIFTFSANVINDRNIGQE